jgi:hypothetical protein
LDKNRKRIKLYAMGTKGIHSKNYTDKKKKFDWGDRMQLTKAFTPFLFEALDKHKAEHPDGVGEIQASIMDYPPRVMVTVVLRPATRENILDEVHSLITEFCSKWGFVWKTWRTQEMGGFVVTLMYQITYTFEEAKFSKYEPYTG